MSTTDRMTNAEQHNVEALTGSKTLIIFSTPQEETILLQGLYRTWLTMDLWPFSTKDASETHSLFPECKALEADRVS